jgi:hypothetical protein
VRYFVGGSLGVVAAALLGTVTGWLTAVRTSHAQRELLRAEWWAIAISTGMNTRPFGYWSCCRSGCLSRISLGGSAGALDGSVAQGSS